MKRSKNRKVGDVSYLAGFVDGEGYLTVLVRLREKRNKPMYSWNPVFTIGNTHKTMLDNLKKEWGVGTVHRCRWETDKWNTSWTWVLASEDIKFVLSHIIPYLRIKKRQAELLLESLPLIHRGRWRTKEEKERLRDIVIEIRKYAKKGVKCKIDVGNIPL